MSDRDPASALPDPISPPPAAPPDRSRRKAWLAFRTWTLVAAGLATAVVAIAAGRRDRPPAAPLPGPPIAQPIATPPVQPVSKPRPRVELVFALDTTSSMSGLIEGAKRKIWSLASFVAKGQPTPDLRIGLVAYRDVGDAYVTRLHDLDDDLDRVYARLRRFRAEGGGDTPEHVARALHEAVHKMSWSQDPSVVKLIYLVGDAPPHTDYDDGFDLARAARAAVAANIAVHTIRCGDDGETEVVWRKVASLGRGQFMTVEQSGGMRDVATPYDDELARLHDKLGETTIAYGVKGASARTAMASAAAAPAAVKVERARFLSAKGRAVGGGGDLVADFEAGNVKLEAVPAAELPAELQGLGAGGLHAAIAARRTERATLNRRIDELTRKRDSHLENEARAAARAGERDGFDAVAKSALRKTVEANTAAGLKL